ncbi:MAG TPA: hypothetical protein ENN68_05405 [Methanomicrobia archaeon]|nr:hypothetical protein [Methanomicrobia archaeon]
MSWLAGLEDHLMNGKILVRLNWRIIYLALFFSAFLIFWVSGEGHPSHFDYYVRLSDAFLHGRLYLLDPPSWLNELVPYDGRYYVVYPPLPAVLMMPLVALVGTGLNQTLVSIFIGSLSVVLACVVARDVLGKDQKGAAPIWAAVLFGFGTIFWYLTSVGSAWYLAHVTAVFFLFLAIHEALTKRRPFVTGLLVGASYWCRLPTILTLAFFAVLIGLTYRRDSAQMPGQILKLVAGASVFVGLNMLYNYVRFGTPFDVGYWLIPGVVDEPWFNQGLFSLSYIHCNLETIFFARPVFTSEPPYVLPPWTGMAIWVTTPAFIYALRSKRTEALTWASWLAILAVASVLFTRGCTGWGFGYRYAMDFYPFLFLLTVKGMGEQLRWHHRALILLSVLVNVWGVIWVNKFGWWA